MFDEFRVLKMLEDFGSFCQQVSLGKGADTAFGVFALVLQQSA
jgi:hypothetical protein